MTENHCRSLLRNTDLTAVVMHPARSPEWHATPVRFLKWHVAEAYVSSPDGERSLIHPAYLFTDPATAAEAVRDLNSGRRALLT